MITVDSLLDAMSCICSEITIRRHHSSDLGAVWEAMAVVDPQHCGRGVDQDLFTAVLHCHDALFESFHDYPEAASPPRREKAS